MRPRSLFDCAAGVALLASALTSSVHAQGSRPSTSPDRLCLNALASQDVQVGAASLRSLTVRQAICGCLLATRLQADETMQAAARRCLSSTSPAEQDFALSSAALAQLSDALGPPGSTREFIPPKLDSSRCDLPKYPEASRRLEATGTSGVAIRIDKRGRVADGIVTTSAGPTPGHKLLDVTALFSLMQCRFEPGSYRGDSIESWTQISYVWKLE